MRLCVQLKIRDHISPLTPIYFYRKSWREKATITEGLQIRKGGGETGGSPPTSSTLKVAASALKKSSFGLSAVNHSGSLRHLRHNLTITCNSG